MVARRTSARRCAADPLARTCSNALIFCNRKRDVDILYKSLKRHGFSVGALHGDLSQPERFATLAKFKAGELDLLVCSDVAARGIDIGGLSHVFNFDVPHHAEDYVHRIGRTGRAGLRATPTPSRPPTIAWRWRRSRSSPAQPIARMTVGGAEPLPWEEGDGRRRGRRAPAATEAAAPPGGRPHRGGRDRDGRRRRAPAAAERRPRSGRSGREPVTPQVEAPEDARQDARQADAPATDARPAEVRPEASRPEAAALPRRERGADRPERDRSAGTERTAERAGGRASERQGERGAERSWDRPTERSGAERDSRRREGWGGQRREGRYRDDDLGPSVRGFGDDVPAFMLLPRRRTPAQVGCGGGHERGGLTPWTRTCPSRGAPSRRPPPTPTARSARARSVAWARSNGTTPCCWRTSSPRTSARCATPPASSARSG